jgi:hypothetical protein
VILSGLLLVNFNEFFGTYPEGLVAPCSTCIDCGSSENPNCMSISCA